MGFGINDVYSWKLQMEIKKLDIASIDFMLSCK